MASPVGLFKVHSSGLKPSKDIPTLVFLCGYPDLSITYSKIAPKFEGTHHVIIMTLPDFEERKLRRFWGYSFDEVAKGIAVVMEPHYKRGSPVHLVAHDFGAWMSLVFASTEFAHMCDRMVLLDVGIRGSFPFLMNLYMAYLALVFLVSRISDLMALLMIMLYPWSLLGPTPHDTDTSVDLKKVRGFWTYLYLQYWFSEPLKFNPKLPQLFMYGAKKRYHYHDQEFLDTLEKTPNCRYKCLEEGGHWFHWTMPDVVVSEIKSYLIDKK